MPTTRLSPVAGPLPAGFIAPPAEFSLTPFWFWNDALDEAELLRQIGDFERHGVHGFVIHPRVGLPRSLGWMSEALLRFYDVAIAEAARRGMVVFLYDEGMYPSGSSCGQVVAGNAAFACRGLARVPWDGDGAPALPAGWNMVAAFPQSGGRGFAVVDRPVGSSIRGLHYVADDPPRHPGPDRASPGSPRPDPPEDQPAAADLLNPDAVACFIRLVYGRFFERFGRHFGTTIAGIFTDEPMLLGRGAPRGVQPGTTGIAGHVSRILGRDFTPDLPALWDDAAPDAARHRADYRRAVQARLEETYYRPLYDWCQSHGVALTGHPDASDAIGLLRHFHIPGQDLVWRYVEPDKASALEGEHATMAKCTSSAMVHGGRRRNANEFCGAYGRGLTFEEMKWLADWCLVRGVNLLFPHAFYYSARGPRVDERPPDVGPHSAWWDARFAGFARHCARLGWLNTDSRHVCKVAILGRADGLPWRAARVLQEAQIDFNYLTDRDLVERAGVASDGIRLAGMSYGALVLEWEADPAVMSSLEPLARAGRVVRYDPAEAAPTLADRVRSVVCDDLRASPAAPALRFRHVTKEGLDWYLLFNESREPLSANVSLAARGIRQFVDPGTGDCAPWPEGEPLRLGGHELRVAVVAGHCEPG